MSADLVILFRLHGARDVYAWGDTGHEIIYEIAFQELNPQARARVIQLLQRDPDFKLFSKACTWPDHPRTRAHEHFVNLPRAASGIGGDPCPLQTWPRPPGSSSLLILMAKSEKHAIDRRYEPENRVGQRTIPAKLTSPSVSLLVTEILEP